MDVNYNTQSALSIPLSNIIDSGDGYIQYSNGLQICYGIYSKVKDGSTISFSKSFLNDTTPFVIVSPNIEYENAVMVFLTIHAVHIRAGNSLLGRTPSPSATGFIINGNSFRTDDIIGGTTDENFTGVKYNAKIIPIPESLSGSYIAIGKWK